MKCVQCNAEFVPSKNPRHIYCGKVCGKRAHREATEILKGNEGPDLTPVPHQTRVNRIDVPLIPDEYRFLYPPVSCQEEMRAAAVRTMVAMGDQ